MVLLEALCELFPQVGRAEWLRRCEEGRFLNYGGEKRGADHVVRAGERVLQVFPPEAEPEVATDIRVLYEDEAILVVQKPAPLPMHSGGRFHRNTLSHVLNLACAPHVVRMVHRLDANTSGVVVFARTRHVARVLGRQFVEGEAKKKYLVRVTGHPLEDVFSCAAAISKEPEFAGGRTIDEEEGDEAFTSFRVLGRCEDGTSMLEARPVTGRTHQIRLHLRQLGFPVVGDPCYGSEVQDGRPATLSAGDPPMMLHAASLEITHPRSGEKVMFEADPPAWVV
jgi:UPF0176 protein